MHSRHAVLYIAPRHPGTFAAHAGKLCKLHAAQPGVQSHTPSSVSRAQRAASRRSGRAVAHEDRACRLIVLDSAASHVVSSCSAALRSCDPRCCVTTRLPRVGCVESHAWRAPVCAASMLGERAPRASSCRRQRDGCCLGCSSHRRRRRCCTCWCRCSVTARCGQAAPSCHSRGPLGRSEADAPRTHVPSLAFSERRTVTLRCRYCGRDCGCPELAGPVQYGVAALSVHRHVQ